MEAIVRDLVLLPLAIFATLGRLVWAAIRGRLREGSQDERTRWENGDDLTVSPPVAGLAAALLFAVIFETAWQGFPTPVGRVIGVLLGLGAWRDALPPLITALIMLGLFYVLLGAVARSAVGQSLPEVRVERDVLIYQVAGYVAGMPAALVAGLALATGFIYLDERFGVPEVVKSQLGLMALAGPLFAALLLIGFELSPRLGPKPGRLARLSASYLGFIAFMSIVAAYSLANTVLPLVQPRFGVVHIACTKASDRVEVKALLRNATSEAYVLRPNDLEIEFVREIDGERQHWLILEEPAPSVFLHVPPDSALVLRGYVPLNAEDEDLARRPPCQLASPDGRAPWQTARRAAAEAEEEWVKEELRGRPEPALNILWRHLWD